MSDFETPDELRPWSIVDKATLALVIISGVTWLVQAGLFFMVSFESSMYEMSAARWWLGQLYCLPIYLAVIGLSSAPAVLMLCGRTAFAFLAAALSSVLFYALFVSDWGRSVF